MASAEVFEKAGDKVIIGRLHGPHGIKGWNKLQAFTETPDNIADYKQWFIKPSQGRGAQGDWQAVEWDELRWQGKRLVVRLQGSTDRNRAEELAGHDIAVSEDQLPTLEQGEYYWHQLQGLQVVVEQDSKQVLLGVVSDMLETGANDVLVVRGKGVEGALDKQERLIPWLPGDVIEYVDLERGCILVQWDPEF